MYRPNVRYRQQAFTLIELLVVISVILIAASIVVVTGRGGSGAALSSSTRIVNSIVQGARGQAILQNAPARLIIYAEEDNEDPDKFLRFFGIVYADPNDPKPDNPTNWIAATQGTYLPRGIYFHPRVSEINTINNSSAWRRDRRMQIEFPRANPVKEGSGSNFYWFEFQPNGRPTDANAWLVLRAGNIISNDAGALSIQFPFDVEEGGRLRSALIIRPAGTATIVSDPDAIDIAVID